MPTAAPRPAHACDLAACRYPCRVEDALRERKTTPAEIARHAERGGVATVIRPYLEAFTADA